MDLFRRMRWPMITRRDADRLLDHRPAVDPPSGLADLLAAAAAPPRSQERAGEASALAVFRREFRPRPAATGGRPSRAGHRPTRPRRHRVAVVLSCALVAVVGGTAFAAGTNRLPDPVQRHLHDALAGVGIPPPDGQGPDGTAPRRYPSPAPPGASPDRAALVALCRSWREAQDTPGAPEPRPDDRRALADAAGGENRIRDFCAALDLAATPDPSTASTPGQPGGAGPSGPSASTPGRGNGNGHGGDGDGDGDGGSGGKGNGGNGKGNGPNG